MARSGTWKEDSSGGGGLQVFAGIFAIVGLIGLVVWQRAMEARADEAAERTRQLRLELEIAQAHAAAAPEVVQVAPGWLVPLLVFFAVAAVVLVAAFVLYRRVNLQERNVGAARAFARGRRQVAAGSSVEVLDVQRTRAVEGHRPASLDPGLYALDERPLSEIAASRRNGRAR